MKTVGTHLPVTALKRALKLARKPGRTPGRRLAAWALALAACAPWATPVWAADGMLASKSPHSAKETMTRLEEQVKQRGMQVFLRLDHAAGAARVGKTLRATELLVFGGPQGGTPLIECAQSAGIDLPLKALVWEDETGQVWLGVNDPTYLAKRHDVPACPAAAGLSKALASLTEATLKP